MIWEFAGRWSRFLLHMEGKRMHGRKSLPVQGTQWESESVQKLPKFISFFQGTVTFLGVWIKKPPGASFFILRNSFLMWNTSLGHMGMRKYRKSAACEKSLERPAILGIGLKMLKETLRPLLPSCSIILLFPLHFLPEKNLRIIISSNTNSRKWQIPRN